MPSPSGGQSGDEQGSGSDPDLGDAGDNSGQGGQGDGQGGDGQSAPGAGKAAPNKERFVGSPTTGKIPDWGRIAAQCAAASQGSGSGKVLRRATEPPPGRVRVDRVLRHAFSQAAVAHGRDDFSFRKRSRRALEEDGPILPGFTSFRASAAIVIDTSGSMGDEAIAQAIKWTVAIARECGVRPFLVAHTDRAYYADWISTEVSLKEVRQALNESGGTSFEDAFAKVSAAKGRFDVMIQLTDGEAYWPTPSKPYNVKRQVIALLGMRCKHYVPSDARVIDATID